MPYPGLRQGEASLGTDRSGRCKKFLACRRCRLLVLLPQISFLLFYRTLEVEEATNRAQEQGGAHAVMPQPQIFRWLPPENDTHDGLVCDAQTVLAREGIMNERVHTSFKQ
jgi:hypothetical protein